MNLINRKSLISINILIESEILIVILLEIKDVNKHKNIIIWMILIIIIWKNQNNIKLIVILNKISLIIKMIIIGR